MEADKQDKIYDKIREITSENPSLTPNAVETLKLTELGKKAIQSEEKRLNRPLDLEDFRQIKELRLLVVDTLFVKNIEQFKDIIEEFEAKAKELQHVDIF